MFGGGVPYIWIYKNIIRNTRLSGFDRCNFWHNECHFLMLGGVFLTDHQINSSLIRDNKFSGEINLEQLSIYKHDFWKSRNYNGICVSINKMDELKLITNSVETLQENIF